MLNAYDIKPLKNTRINLPIGISFYTFHGISYVVDIYREKAEAQKNILHLGLYFMFFPQLIAGPIVRYHQIEQQLSIRHISLDKIYLGLERFIFGLAKKTIIANSFALIADEIFALNNNKIDIFYAWMGAISYTIQIYFDFSAYTDMAIGLAMMFGFTFPENFNLPYVSQSIKEFWQRWHISLSSWFKDYLYIPLGGNKLSDTKTYMNLFIVFLCTGFWHGASYNFIIWGLFHGLFIILERMGIIDTLFSNKLSKHVYTLLIVIIAWIFFRADTIDQSFAFIKAMFGFASLKANIIPVLSYLNLEMLLVAAIAICMMFGLHLKIYNAMQSVSFMKKFGEQPLAVVRSLSIFCLLLLSVIYIGASTYNSFIYFRF